MNFYEYYNANDIKQKNNDVSRERKAIQRKQTVMGIMIITLLLLRLFPYHFHLNLTLLTTPSHRPLLS